MLPANRIQAATPAATVGLMPKALIVWPPVVMKRTNPPKPPSGCSSFFAFLTGFFDDWPCAPNSIAVAGARDTTTAGV
eukprot:CAMPEP_0185318880 /NCGR_PEP_ID=MMETSP1363-20130426/50709_1 /TAXON_ID=38817 /ORGANISM="Gephyrocapsa oceanica, Strain RCC1303" /LENGTH=77 /DNA_ID=CAMNT_0027917203 /DNA_START=448 /DNA_END=677 /DNA_ORIENTATION=+